MAPEVKHVEVSEAAYRKLVLHAAKYASSTVVGILVGKHAPTVAVHDIIPLTHHWTQLSPMTEAGLAMINAHLQGKDDQVVGVYEVPESLHAKEPASTTSVLARKVADATGKPALLLFADGKKLLDEKPTALTASVEQAAGKSKALNEQAVSVHGYKQLVATLEKEVYEGRWRDLADWDDHVENTRLDWLTNAQVVP